MSRFIRPLLWFVLVPYFAVLRLNAPAGIGESRAHTNRTNAQLVLALILISPVLFALAATGSLKRGLPQSHPYIFALIVFLPAALGVGFWLKGDREALYRREYGRLPVAARAIFGLTTAALVVAGFIAFIVPR
jgi:hypothetical protein